MSDKTIHQTLSPFHAGERTVQSRMGVRNIEEWARRVIRDYMPEQHRDFFTALPFLVVSARDKEGRPWSTILEGPEGFVASPSIRTLTIDAKPVEGDALEGAIQEGDDVGILGIELASRRRNRANGRVTQLGEVTSFAVDQSFGNCPQYIRERQWHRVTVEGPARALRSRTLSADQIAWIEWADTFFLATGFRGDEEQRSFGMDTSHRGGDRGFVKVLDSRHIRFPDYAGNNYYNTIGNMLSDPRSGYLFVDFSTGALLQVTGRATLDWDSPAVKADPGARLLVTLEVEEVVEVQNALSLRWQEDAESVRDLRLIEKVRESTDVMSFYFEARDKGLLTFHRAGQHLPVELRIPGIDGPAKRTYSLSSGPADDHYRITVKREPKGLVSPFLHDELEVGALVNARKPSGDFMAPDGEAPLVLVSAGVGVTPMLSIMRDVVASGPSRPVLFVHGARDGSQHPLAQEIRELSIQTDQIRVHVAYSQPRPEDQVEGSFDTEGRVTVDLLLALKPDQGAHFLICGPVTFMADIQAGLEDRGIPSDQIHTESFGPVA